MNELEWVAALATISSVLMLAKGKSSGWALGIIGSVLYGWVFIEQKLYANFILQIIFTIQGLYGIFEWNKSVPVDKPFSSKKMDSISLMAMISLAIAVGVTLSTIISLTTENSSQFLDILLSICSVFALVMMAKRFIQSWFMWMAIDIGYIYLFLSTDMWVSAGLYFLLFLICINGYIKWKNSEIEVEQIQS